MKITCISCLARHVCFIRRALKEIAIDAHKFGIVNSPFTVLDEFAKNCLRYMNDPEMEE